MPAPDRTTALLESTRRARRRGTPDPASSPPEGVEPLGDGWSPEALDARLAAYGRPSPVPAEGSGRARRAGRGVALTEAHERRRPLRGGDGAYGGDLPSDGFRRGRDGVFELPSGLAGAAVVPPWAAVVGAAIVVILAVGFVIAAVLRDDSAATPVPTRAPSAPVAGRLGEGSSTGRPSTAPVPAPPVPRASPGGPAGTTATAGASLVVHVVGEVKRPAVVRVPAGSRVEDAVRAAGGPTRKAVLTGLNLARPVVDGEQIVVPDSATAPLPIATDPPPSGAATGVVDLNAADQSTLEQLPGVGPKLAQSILQWRAQHGRFSSVDELGEVDGIGEKRLEQLRPHVRV